jgi:putative nucleotidyltransferase with HDIG domain
VNESLASALERADALRPAREALAGTEAWLVGGSVRDLLSGRRVEDVDVVVPEDAEGAARKVAGRGGDHVFALSDRFGGWRVIARDRSWQADVTPMRGGSIEADLALRDFTINAMATPLPGGERILDPHGGRGDLDAGLVRMVSARAYADDPLRTLRLARLACELRFEVDAGTEREAARHARELSSVSPERVYYELRRLISADEVLRGIDLMDRTGLVAVLLPELEGLKGVEQNPYHHLDVWGHTLAVLDQLVQVEREPERVFRDAAAQVGAELSRPLADDLTRWGALRIAALFHDVAKPATRQVTKEGRVLFWGHDELGARMAEAACRRLRASGALGEFVAAIARHHLRLGFLVHERPLSRRHVYRYLRACEPVELEVTVLSVADRLATRGERTREEAVEAHVALASELAAEALAWRAAGGAPRPPVRGDELAEALGVARGPLVGELLELIREGVFAGEVSSRHDALELARRAR